MLNNHKNNNRYLLLNEITFFNVSKFTLRANSVFNLSGNKPIVLISWPPPPQPLIHIIIKENETINQLINQSINIIDLANIQMKSKQILIILRLKYKQLLNRTEDNKQNNNDHYIILYYTMKTIQTH